MVTLTVGLYILTTLCAVTLGVLSTLAFSSKFPKNEDLATSVIVPEVRLGCSVDVVTGVATSFLEELDNGTIVCDANNVQTSQSLFLMEDVNGYFATSPSATVVTEMTLSESLYQGFFMQLIGPNMFGLFIDNNFLGVIILAVCPSYTL